MQSIYLLVIAGTLFDASKAADPLPKEVAEAEAIARVHRSLANHKAELKRLQEMLDDPESEYRKAEAAFNQLDAMREEKLKQKAQLTKDGKTTELATLEKELKDLEEKWTLERKRFTLAVQEKKAIQQKIATLPDLIQKEQAELSKLLGEKKPTTKPTPPVTTPPKTDQVPPKKAQTPVKPPTPVEKKPAEDTPEIRRAKEQAKARGKEASEAKEKAQTLEERISALRKLIDAEKKVLQASRQKVDLVRQNVATMRKERRSLQQKPDDNRAKLDALDEQISDASDQEQKESMEVRNSTDRLNNLQKTLNELQSERIRALQDAKRKSQQAEAAKKHLEDLQNPYSPRNIVQWLLKTGPKLIAVVLAMILLHGLSRWGSKRLVAIMARRGRRKGRWEQEDRAQTLTGIFRNMTAWLIWGGGILMILDLLGVPVVPLMGGAAIFGLAIAFGAQNLVRDYFTGFMVLMEDQYAVNDYIRIGSVEGVVERITLRITVLRDMEGAVHFVPHGTISTVSNLTHGWSRAVFSIGIAYKENADEVMVILRELAMALKEDPEYGPWILEDPEMLGVNSFDDSAVTIRFHIKTRPLKQWKIRREMLRRIKQRFDELGIEIPFPHRTVYHRHDGPTDDQEKLVA